MKNPTLSNIRSLTEILEQGGFLTEGELSVFSVLFPNALIGIRFGCSERKSVYASEVQSVVEETLKKNPADYVRDYFLPCNGSAEKTWKAFNALDATFDE